jgi:hypothetical protein
MNNENEINYNDEIEDLDLDWIQEFEKIDNEYKVYYTEELSFIRIHSIYVNNNNDIEKIREQKIILKNPGILSKEELLSIIKHNSFSNEIKYSLLSILKFNINLEPFNLKTFLRNKNPAIGAPFLQSIKNLDSIKFDKSITMFHDINEILIIFHQKVKKNNKGSNPHDNKNYTKKVFINSNTKKKTKKKELKESTP